MIFSLVVLVLFDAAGEAASKFLPIPLPGPVVGMLLLFGALAVRPSAAGKVAPGAELLLRWMALFFVPAGVGVVTKMAVLRAEWLAVSTALVASTVLGMLATAATFALVARGRK